MIIRLKVKRKNTPRPAIRRTPLVRRLLHLHADMVQKHVEPMGLRPGLKTDEKERLKELERENRELRRANEILRKASAYFAQAELDRRAR